MAEEQEQEPNITLTQTELKEFITALREELVEAITQNNTQAMVSLFENVFPPFMERLDQVAVAQVTLANALRTNRRDYNANEFAKLLIARAMATPEGIDKNALHLIPAEAYALADEMDIHGRVAEAQAESKGERMDEAVKDKPRHVPAKEFVDNFFGRKAKVDPPKIQPKAAGFKKKH
jgi:hypothetical protein